jgi:dihydromethanopterin reductase (acceptor)
MNVAWGITGAGHFLKETFDEMETISKEHKITTFLSKSGEEVVKAYGLWKNLRKISPGDYLQEVFTPEKEGSSSPSTGRFFLKKYEMLIIAPATTNTVAKIVMGISDTLVTNAASHCLKSMTPLYILPADVSGKTKTNLPYFLDKVLCKFCEVCPPAKECKERAIYNHRINLLKCTGCGICEKICKYGAIIQGKEVDIRPRKIDLENVERLKKMEFVKVLNEPQHIKRLL